MREYQVSYRGNRLVTKDNIIDVLNELGYQPGNGKSGLQLLSITSWYLKTTQSSGVTVEHPENPTLDNLGWQIGFILPDPTNRYVWKFSDYHYGDPDHEEIEGFHIYTNCELVSIYSSSDSTLGIEFAYTLFGKDVDRVELTDGTGIWPVAYGYSSTGEEVEDPNPLTAWTGDVGSLAYGASAYLWMSQRRTGEGQVWSSPIRLSGEDGSPGADGRNIEFIYKHLNRLPDVDTYPSDRPYSPGVSNQEKPEGWEDHPSGVGYFIEEENGQNVENFYRYEWASYRLRINNPTTAVIWDAWSDPIVWSAYGEKGMDGDGVEYIYMRNEAYSNLDDPPASPKFEYGNSGQTRNWDGNVYLEGSDPNNPNDWKPKGWDGTGFVRWIGGKYGPQGEWLPMLDKDGNPDDSSNYWTDDPKGVSEPNPKEWVSQRKYVNGSWGTFSPPKVWSTFSKEHTVEIIDGEWWIDGENQHIKAEGENGKGIDLKGRVDFLDSYHEEQFMQENPDFLFEPGHIVTYLKDVDDETSDDFRDPEVGDCYVVTYNGHIYLYVGGEDADWTKHWHNFGEFQGEGAYVHIAWAHRIYTDEWGVLRHDGFVLDREITNNSTIEYEWMGICTNHDINDPDANVDPSKLTEYKWNYVHGRDGDNYERVYLRTTQKTVVPIIEKTNGTYRDDYQGHGYQESSVEYIPWVANPQECGAENHGSSAVPVWRFTDDPKGTELEYPYEWIAERKKVDGIWQDFNTPSIHTNYAYDGQSVVRSTVFKRSESKPAQPVGGWFGNPYPTNEVWDDGLPSGTGPIWMSSKIFTSDGQAPQENGNVWPDPILLRDSGDLDIEFSPQSTEGTIIPPINFDEEGGNRHDPSHPSTASSPGYNEQLWFDPELDSDYISAHSKEMNWMATRTSFVDPSTNQSMWRDWVIVLIKGETGEPGKNFDHAYIVFPNDRNIFDYWVTDQTTATNVPPASITISSTTYTWVLNTTSGINVGENQSLWMTERLSSSTFPGPWSRPVKISGNGSPGEDAEDIEFIYKRSDRLPSPTEDKPSYGPLSNVQDSHGHYFEDDDFVPGDVPGATGTNIGWTDNPKGVGTDSVSGIFYKYEWMCQRIKPRGVNQAWENWSNVFVWSAYGDTGMDGDGIEYVFTRSTDHPTPAGPKAYTSTGDTVDWNWGVEKINSAWKPKDWSSHITGKGDFNSWVGGKYEINQGEWLPKIQPDGGDFESNYWTDDPKGVGEVGSTTYYYEWVSSRKRVNGEWGGFSTPAIWSSYSKAPHLYIDEEGYWCDDNGRIRDSNGNWVHAEGPSGEGVAVKGSVDVIYSVDKEEGQTALQDIYPHQDPVTEEWYYRDIAPGDCYVVRETGHLYLCLHNLESPWNFTNQVPDGPGDKDWEPVYSESNNNPNWEDIGEFQGQGSYMHIAWAASVDPTSPYRNDGDNILFDNGQISLIRYFLIDYAAKSPNVNYDWMGVLTDNDKNDLPCNYKGEGWADNDLSTQNWYKYKWNNVRGRDGDNYERVYLKTKSSTRPEIDCNEDQETGAITYDSYFDDTYPNDGGEGHTYQKPEYLPIVVGYDSEEHSGTVINSVGHFTDDPVSVDEDYPYGWMAERRKKLNTETHQVEWFPFSFPSIWAKYSFNGGDGESSEVRYTSALISTGLTISNSSAETPSSTYEFGGTSYTPIWQTTTTGLTVDSTHFLWMTQRRIRGSVVISGWSVPVRLSGEDGVPGKDGADIEFIYKRSNDESTPASPSDPVAVKSGEQPEYYYGDVNATTGAPLSWTQGSWTGWSWDQSAGEWNEEGEWIPTGWEDSPLGVDSSHKYEWACQRTKSSGINQQWSTWVGPFKWSAYGDTGMDGDGIEYVFYRYQGNGSLQTPSGPKALTSSTEHNEPGEGIDWRGGVHLNPDRNPQGLSNYTIQSNDWLPTHWDSSNGIGTWAGWDPNFGRYNEQGEWIPVVKFNNDSTNPDPSEWSDDPLGVGYFDEDNDPTTSPTLYLYEYVSTRKRTNGEWGDFSEPKIWASWGTDISISDDGFWIINGQKTTKIAEGQNGTGIALKGSVDFLNNKDRSDYADENNLSAAEEAELTTLQEIQPNAANSDNEIPSVVDIGDCYVVKQNRYLYTSKRRFNNQSPVGNTWSVTDQGADYWWTTGTSESPQPGPGQTNWAEVGEFQGVGSYMHIAWAESKNITWDTTDPNKIIGIDGLILAYEDKDVGIEYDWMGICTDNNDHDPSSWSDYKWNHVRGKDGSDDEKVYVRTKSESIKPTINQNSYNGGNGQHNNPLNDEFYPQVLNKTTYPDDIENSTFTDDPHGVSSTWPYEWVAERQKVLDTHTQRMVWGQFKEAKLWATYSFDGITANITNSAESINIDAAGNLIGGYGQTDPNQSNFSPRLRTNIDIYDPRAGNGNGANLTYRANENTLNAGEYDLNITATNCSYRVTSDGIIYIYVITDLTLESCHLDITVTTYGNKEFNFGYKVNLCHIPQTYLTYTLTNDSDIFTYLTGSKKYNGLPITTTLEVLTTDGAPRKLNESTNKSTGYIKSLSVKSNLLDNAYTSKRASANNKIQNSTLTTSDTVVNSSNGNLTTSTATAYIFTSDGTYTNLKLVLDSKAGEVTLDRDVTTNGTTDVDLPDGTHNLEISCSAVLGNVTYNSLAKTFKLSEKNDTVLYKLILHCDSFLEKEDGSYEPAENTFSVDVNVYDSEGTTKVTPGNNGEIRDNVFVRYINGPSTDPATDFAANKIENSPIQFSRVSSSFTVLVVEYNSNNVPILYHDTETVDINPYVSPIGQSYLTIIPKHFVVDCNSSKNVITSRTLSISAYLHYGDSVCTDFTIEEEDDGIEITDTLTGESVERYDDLSVGDDGEVTKTYRFNSGLGLNSGEINITLSGYIDGELRSASDTITVSAVQQGETGPSGDFKSTAFIRTETDISTYKPYGLTSENCPEGLKTSSGTVVSGFSNWSDGIPSGNLTLWATTLTIKGDGSTNTNNWTNPRQMTDTQYYDVEFSDVDINPGNPTDNKANWFDPKSKRYRDWVETTNEHEYEGDWKDVYWRAEKEIRNGVEDLEWTILRIKGESVPSVQPDRTRIVITTDPTGKLSSQSSISLQARLFVGDVQQPLVLSNRLKCKVKYRSFNPSSDNDLEVTATNIQIDSVSGDSYAYWNSSIIIPSGVVLRNSDLKITLENSTYTAYGTVPVVFERQTRSSFKSFVFKRFASPTEAANGTPSGGSFTSPTPNPANGWTDGIPNDGTNNPIYMSHRTFTSDGSGQTNWTIPALMSDSDNFNVEFSPADSITPPSAPVSGSDGNMHGCIPPTNQIWYDPTDDSSYFSDHAEDMIWMATSTTKDNNGNWINWAIVKIKGETGDTGTGIRSITPWYKAFDTLDVVIPSAGNETDGWAEDNDLTDAGWVNSYIKPTKENPYLWKFTRTVYQHPYKVVHDGLEMIQVWSENMINPNLLEDTEFTDINHISAWTQAGKPFNNTYSGTITTGIESNAYNNKNSFYVNSSNCNVSIYMLQQYVTGKIVPSEWYTLSFWVKCSKSGSNTIHVSIKFGNPSTVLLDETSSLNYSNDTSSDQAYIQLKNVSNSWSRRTITFKSSDPTSSNYYEYIQFMMLNTTGTSRRFDFCMPKLETGKVATDYIESLIKDPYPRLTVWGTGKQYYRGNYGEPYLDAVTLGGNSWFRCRTTHISNNDNKPRVGQTTAYWEPAQNLDFIVTDLLLAETAFIKNLTVGGLRTDDMGKPHVEMVGSNINFYGRANFPNIKMNVDEDNMAYLEFYDKNNTFLYDLGPSGIRWKVTVTSASCIQNTSLVKTTTTDSNNLPKPDFTVGGTVDTSLWRFSPAREDGVIVGDSNYTKNNDSIANRANGKYFTSTTFVKQVDGSWILDESKYANYMYRRQDEPIDTLSTNLGNYSASTINNAIQNWKDDLVMFWNFPSGSISEINDAYTVNNNIATITYPVYRQVYINIVNGFSNTFYAFKQQNTIWMVLA